MNREKEIISILAFVLLASVLVLIIKSNIDADQARRLTTEASR